jgi:hypothetical protein
MQGFLTCRKILRHGIDDFTSPPKEGIMSIFIAFKYVASAWFDYENLGSNGRYANHYTTEATTYVYSWILLCLLEFSIKTTT